MRSNLARERASIRTVVSLLSSELVCGMVGVDELANEDEDDAAAERGCWARECDRLICWVMNELRKESTESVSFLLFGVFN